MAIRTGLTSDKLFVMPVMGFPRSLFRGSVRHWRVGRINRLTCWRRLRLFAEDDRIHNGSRQRGEDQRPKHPLTNRAGRLAGRRLSRIGLTLSSHDGLVVGEAETNG